MRVFELFHKMLKKSLPKLHSKRILALLVAAEALIKGKKLTLTGLGRSMTNSCTPKSAIRKVDRLLGNGHVHKERVLYYQYISGLLLSCIKKPLISVDWTGTPRHNFYCIRASLNLKGRSLVLYEEVHPRKLEKNTRINNLFLDNLKNVIPKTCHPIIVTDAGFRSPWFKKVQSLNWDFLGRARNANYYFDLIQNIWINTLSLYEHATSTAKFVGRVLYTKRSKLECNMYVYRGKIKGRKNINRNGQVSKRGVSKVYSKSHRDPLVVVTSVGFDLYSSKQVINMYERRMEIEEEFRDLKSTRYGYGIRNSGTKSTQRLQVLLLISALASFMSWMIALSIKREGGHYKYQANTHKTQNVLSIQFLASEAYRWLGNKLSLSMNDINKSLFEMKTFCLVCLS